MSAAVVGLLPPGTPERFDRWRPAWEIAVEATRVLVGDPAWWVALGFDPLRLSPGQFRSGVATASLGLGLGLGRSEVALVLASLLAGPSPIRCLGPGCLRVVA